MTSKRDPRAASRMSICSRESSCSGGSRMPSILGGSAGGWGEGGVGDWGGGWCVGACGEGSRIPPTAGWRAGRGGVGDWGGGWRVGACGEGARTSPIAGVVGGVEGEGNSSKTADVHPSPTSHTTAAKVSATRCFSRSSSAARASRGSKSTASLTHATIVRAGAPRSTPARAAGESLRASVAARSIRVTSDRSSAFSWSGGR